MESQAIMKLIELQETMHKDLTLFVIVIVGILAFETYLIYKSKENTQE